MCYAKPGPRCSYHAKEKLKKVIALHKQATDPHEAQMLQLKVQKARHLFYETKEGLDHLEKKMGKDSEIYELFSNIREKKLQAYKDKFIIQNKEMIFGNNKSIKHKNKVEQTLKKVGLWEKAQEQQAMLETAILKKEPLTTEQITAHRNYVSQIISVMNQESLSTEDSFSRHTQAGQLWDRERTRLQDKIIDDYVNKHKHVPCEGKLFVSGGMGGAGKTSTIKNHNVVDTDNYAVINPDDLKEEMAKRNMIPHIPGTMSMEVNPLVHEEASMMSKKIMDRMLAEKKNVLLDITMSSVTSTESKIMKFKKQGYRVEAMFVDIDTKTSKNRGMTRYITGTQKTLMAGKGHGGRFLPPKLVDNQKSNRTGVSSINAENINILYKKNIFDSEPQIFDNRGNAPIRLNSKDFFNNIDRS